ncbi:hypothetical protein ISS08_02050 [Candidatus Pacearchaeota archaeon]|nr:hypothetical protein [Candidatus Pacearchaeota archaeon]
MAHKKSILFVASLFLLVVLLGNISADVCKIDTIESCESGGFNLVLGMSGETNAHAEYLQNNAPGNYGYALCCDWGNGVQPSSCTNYPKIIGISSDTNAHSQIPTLTTYTREICYENLNCQASDQNPNPATLNEILSFSSDTNAHIGQPLEYPIGLYCSVDFIGPGEAYCGDGDVEENEECDMGPNWTNPLNCISPEISELDKCDCQLGYGPLYDPDDLEPNTGCGWSGSAVRYWSESSEGGFQISAPLSITLGVTTVYLVVEDLTATDGTPVTFEIYENDVLFDDDIRVGENSITTTYLNGKAIANWTPSLNDIENSKNTGEGDEYEYYFETDAGSSLSDLVIIIGNEVPCEIKNSCSDYVDNSSCTNDVCNVADNSLETIDCNTVDCSCFWTEETSVCGPSWRSAMGGTCDYVNSEENNCENDLFLSYSWVATWIEGVAGDPAEADCVDGSAVVPCPAQVELPFFNIYNLGITVVVIALIYWLLNLKDKPKKKKTISKKK